MHGINGFPTAYNNCAPTPRSNGGNPGSNGGRGNGGLSKLLSQIQLKSVHLNSHGGGVKSVKIRSIHSNNNISLGALGLSQFKNVKSANLKSVCLGSANFKSGCTSHGAYKSIHVGNLVIKSLKIKSGHIKSLKFASIKSGQAREEGCN